MYFDLIVLMLLVCLVFGHYKHGQFVYKGDIPYGDRSSALQELLIPTGMNKIIYCTLECQRKTDCKAVALCSKNDEDICILRSKRLYSFTKSNGDVCRYMDSITDERIQDCQMPWLYYNGHCYLFTKERVSWYVAKKSCEEKSSYLVEINNAEEHEWLFKRSDVGFPWLWTGGIGKESFTWAHSKQPLVFVGQWIDGRPITTTKTCISLVTKFAEFNKGKWMDMYCDSSAIYYICEK